MNKQNIRLCIGKLEGSYWASNGKVVGPDSAYVSFYYSPLFDLFNATLIDKDHECDIIGSQEPDGTYLYDGCLGSIQMNETDYAIGAYNHPVIGRNISMGASMTGVNTMILSAYDPKVTPNKITILTSLDSTSLGVKFLFIYFMVLFYYLFHGLLTCRVFNRKRSVRPVSLSIDIIMGSLLKQHSCFDSTLDSLKKSFRPLSFLVVIFTFLFTCYLCCLIKTEQVIVDEPESIQSYYKILKSNGRIVPMFIYAHNEYNSFKFSLVESKQRIWNTMLTQFGGLNASMIMNKEGLFDALDKISRQEAVTIITSQAKVAFITNSCLVFKIEIGRAHV